MNKKIIAALLALPLFAPALVKAQDNAVRISGFGTAALT